ncbi:MAG: DUF465 domain-containing protein [Gammaproteobacteria bacterium]|nr:DUF465 domain-containing protein [Gammaproteobacteria bacterium]
MMGEKHDLAHELPEYKDKIHELKMNNNHFSRLFEKYHDVTKEVERIEDGIENTSDDYLEELKKQRLALKDEMFAMLSK